MEQHKHIILFDGVCNLCNSSVQFVINRDKKAKFKFTSLQSSNGVQLLHKYQLPADTFNSFVYIRNNTPLQQSTAALYVLRDIGGLWQLLFGLIIISPFIRNGVYNYIAKNRYKWFGKRESCMIPTPELRQRFLD